MAPQVVKDFVSLVRAHPVIFGGVLILFTPPFFPIVKFFSPLLISTALFMLALFTMGPKGDRRGGDDEDRELVEERGDGDAEKIAMKPDGGWKDWVNSIEESSLSWMSSSPRASKHTNDDNWKHGVLNDENVSILEEASWMSKGADYTALGEDGSSSENNNNANNNDNNSFMPTLMTPSALFKVDSDLQACAVERAIYDDNDMALSEDAPELEDVVEPVDASHHQPAAPIESSPPAPDEQASETHLQQQPSGVVHQPFQIPVSQAAEIVDSPATDLDDDSPAVDSNNSRRLLYANLRRSSVNASSGLSDVDLDTPVAAKLSLSGKFQQLEKLGDFLDAAEHAEHAGQESPKVGLLQPTTAEQVDDVKDQLESFVSERDTAPAPSPPNPNHGAAANKSSETASHPLNVADSTTTTEMRKQLSSDSASSETVLLSDSDSELEIFPSADPAKMKLHPPVKLVSAANPVATHA